MAEVMRHFRSDGLLNSALLYSFCIPLHQQMATWAMALWFALTIFSRINKLSYARTDWKWGILPLYFLLYAAWEIVLSPSTQMSFIGHKFSLLIFPAIFLLNPLTFKEIEAIFKSFIYGLITASIICIFTGLYNSIAFQQGSFVFNPAVEPGRGFLESIIFGGNNFFGTQLSRFHQTIYFALYLCTGLAIIIQQKSILPRSVRRLTIIFFAIMIFLVSNKAGLLCLALLLLHWALKWQSGGFPSYLRLLLVVLSVGLLFWYNPRMRLGMGHIAFSTQELNPNARYGLELRLLSWDSAIELIKERTALGYGPSESQKALDNYYSQHGYKEPLAHSHNAHNQFLQSWLEMGIIGLLMFSGIIVLSFYGALTKKENQWLYLWIALILLINANFESILSRFSGISFFSFFVSLTFHRITIKSADFAS